jgi:hypothetical protein
MKCLQWWDQRYVALVLLSLAIWAGAPVSSASAEEDETLRNVALVVIPREILLQRPGGQ